MPYKDPVIRRLKQQEAQRRYYQRHKEKCRKAASEWKKQHRVHVRKYKSEWNKRHREDRRRWARTYHTRHRQQRSEKRKQHYRKNRAYVLSVCKKYRDTHKEQIRMYQKKRQQIDRTRLRDYYRKQKQIVVDAYGGKCECCGDTHFEFLTIDHINGGGRKDRKKRAGSAFYRWLAKNGFPRDNYRLLCMNCNFALGKYGHCPHQTTSPVVQSSSLPTAPLLGPNLTPNSDSVSRSH